VRQDGATAGEHVADDMNQADHIIHRSVDRWIELAALGEEVPKLRAIESPRQPIRIPNGARPTLVFEARQQPLAEGPIEEGVVAEQQVSASEHRRERGQVQLLADNVLVAKAGDGGNLRRKLEAGILQPLVDVL